VFTTVPTVLVTPNPPATVRPGNIVLQATNAGTWRNGQTIAIDFGVPIASIPASVNDLILLPGGPGGFAPCPGPLVNGCLSASASGSVLTITKLNDGLMVIGDQILIRSSFVIPNLLSFGIDLNITGNTSGDGIRASFGGALLDTLAPLAFSPSLVQVMRFTSTAPAAAPARKTQTVSE
jgi:hypothetical protein